MKADKSDDRILNSMNGSKLGVNGNMNIVL